ncbi:hypothetical protein [Paenibacillus sp.]|uniref:hypothetical protein n=1 Tax=Paenibacillus sp. TaxID=58172 RepID=UPI0028111E58|nr:hypothetical protein [Paenibacillus sp.]
MPPLPASVPDDLAAMDRIAVKTLQDCMQTVYEDGPKRDRRLWIGDLRTGRDRYKRRTDPNPVAGLGLFPCFMNIFAIHKIDTVGGCSRLRSLRAEPLCIPACSSLVEVE